MTDRRYLSEVIERGLFLLPEVPGELTSLSISGVQGRKSSVSHRLANTVGAATLNEGTADSTIQEVVHTFACERKTFDWRVGPYSTPHDLGQRLLAAGLRLNKKLSGLFIRDWNLPIRVPQGVTVRQACPEDVHLVSTLICEAYPIHAPWADTLSKACLQPPEARGAKISTFVAFAGKETNPVGMATMYQFPDQPVVFFGGASVLPAFRRHGIYSSLVAQRLAVAKRNGVNIAVIQAVEASAEACKKFGFVKFCEIDAYTWDLGT